MLVVMESMEICGYSMGGKDGIVALLLVIRKYKVKGCFYPSFP
jgi:hypothetical protein